jgi:hypothetical protein
MMHQAVKPYFGKMQLIRDGTWNIRQHSKEIISEMFKAQNEVHNQARSTNCNCDTQCHNQNNSASLTISVIGQYRCNYAKMKSAIVEGEEQYVMDQKHQKYTVNMTVPASKVYT